MIYLEEHGKAITSLPGKKDCEGHDSKDIRLPMYERPHSKAEWLLPPAYGRSLLRAIEVAADRCADCPPT